MSSIEKYISPFIAQQFPAFYKENGPNFIAFLRAYYEWLEQQGNTIGESRSLFEYNDIDTTSNQFLRYFKNQFISELPEDVLIDKRLLIKHITDLYRAKGTKRAYELLFRLAFGEDIELYIPSEYIFKPSDNTWKRPIYIEVSSSPYLNNIVGLTITNVEETAVAVVENYIRRLIQGRVVNILEISSLTGNFKNGDKIFPKNVTLYSADDAPKVEGSLIAIAITEGGQNYSVGDILDITGVGVEAKARVAALSSKFSGLVDFILADGGSGYTTNSVVTVKSTLNLRISNASSDFTVGETIVASNTSTNGVITFANTSSLQIVDFTPVDGFVVGDTIQGLSSSSNAVITRVLGGVGSGATFKVGSLTNRETISYSLEVIDSYTNTELDSTGTNSYSIGVSSISGTFTNGDTVTNTANSILIEGTVITGNTISNNESLSNTSLGISGLFVYRADESLILCTGADADLENANLQIGTILVSNTTSSQIQIVRIDPKETINGSGIIDSSNATHINLSNVNGYFVTQSTIIDSNTAAQATIDSVVRLTDWSFSNSSITTDNLDSLITLSLPELTIETGTIASLTAINPGTGYLTKPYITVQEPTVIILNLYDIDGTLKGNNAIIDSLITTGQGSIAAVEVIDSGYGYFDNDVVTLESSNNTSTVRGAAIVYGVGTGSGKWLNRKSFTSDITKIQDSFFYQNYSYEIVAQRMIGTYEALVRNFVHPAGIALFGRYRSINILTDDTDSVVQSSIQQQ